MTSHFKTIRIVLTTTLILLMGYGVGFALDPESGVRAFGYEEPTVVNNLVVTLVGLVGVGMLGFAALLILSVILVWREDPSGPYVAMITGGVYVLVSACAFRAE